jgi:hypothetical protein
MKVTIFYSWQSDLPNNTNRGFIERALSKAIESIKAEAEMVIDPCLERDVQGETGTPDIAQTIFRKIDECRIFVGDVSIINPTTQIDRKTPNPNVLLELGYAARTLSWDYVICIYNTAFGDIKDLPFDLLTKLMCVYTVTKDQGEKSEEREKLTSKLKAALLPMLQRITHKIVVDTAPKPLTPDAASARVKEYLGDERHRIPLKDLIISQGNELAQKIGGSEFPVQMGQITVDTFKERMQKYGEMSQVALAIMIAGCYYGTQAHETLWINLLQQVANPSGGRAGSTALIRFRKYPALLLSYGGGLAAMAGEHYGTLIGLLTKPKIENERRGGDDPLVHRLTPYDVIDSDLVKQIMGEKWYTPMSEHFFQLLREPFRELLNDERQYERRFDRFEYLRSLLEVDVTGRVQTVGRYGWRWQLSDWDVRKEIEDEEASMGLKWPPYQAGWFNGQRERFTAAKKKVDEMIAGLPWH